MVTQRSDSAESSKAETWFVATAGSGTVEFALDDLVVALQSGRVQSRNLVWRQGMGDWLEIEQIPLLQMLAGPPPVAATVQIEARNELDKESPSDNVVKLQSIDEVESTVTPPRLDRLDDNEWTIEPQQPTKADIKPALAKADIKPAIFSIHELVNRGQIEAAKVSESKGPDQAPPPTEQPKPSRLSGRAPPKPRTSVPPKPPPSTVAARSNAPDRAAALSALRPITSVKSSDRTATNTSPSTTVVTYAQSIPPAPVLDQFHSVSASVVKPAEPSTRPPPVATQPVVPREAVKLTAPARSVESEVAPNVAQLPTVTEPVGSLIPSVTSLYPDEPQWRRSRRPLYVVSGVVVAAVAVIAMSLGSAPKHSAKSRSVTASLATPTVTENRESRPIAASVARETTPTAELASPEPPQVSAASSTKPLKRSTISSTNVIQTADTTRSHRRPSRGSDTTAANRPLPEAKTVPAEASSAPKDPPSNSKKLQGSTSSVASWDQGTVERRSWMNPGF